MALVLASPSSNAPDSVAAQESIADNGKVNGFPGERGIITVPDILANAGGVTVSYFEWAQNIQQFRWELERVSQELEKVMVRSYVAVRDVAREKSLDLSEQIPRLSSWPYVLRSRR